ncbi:MAG TPA: nucleotidyltransferase domain-containing protein [Rhodopseudomonas sp.]|uniref:nucleotidyltransferase family protein n=1 Tax=Rhodopseudomonas sp. TaxID=1078 RepID=UPI002ED94D76
MNRLEALATLQRSEHALRARGVRRAALFGSVARGDNRPDSDIDIMVEIDPEAHITVFDYAGLKDFIAGLFDARVDVVNRDSLDRVPGSGVADGGSPRLPGWSGPVSWRKPGG